MSEPHAAVLLELPQRDLGGRLPRGTTSSRRPRPRERAALRFTSTARASGSAGPFYGRPLEEIAALFDTVYVSFYKDLVRRRAARSPGRPT